MRFMEITGGLMVPVSNDEMLVLEMVRGHKGPLAKREMNEQQQELARRLVFRGVLDRTNIDGRTFYTYNEVEYVER